MVTKERPSLKDGPRVPEKKRRLEDRCKNCHSIFIYYRNKKKKINPKNFCNIHCQREFKRNVALKKNKELFGPYEDFTPVPKVRKEFLREVDHITNGIKVYKDQLYRGKWSWSDSKGRVISDWERNEKVRAKEKKWHYKN